jgi:hypothetical protein
MIGPTIVFLCAASLVVTYIVVVNRMLRKDENWCDPTAYTPLAEEPKQQFQFAQTVRA